MLRVDCPLVSIGIPTYRRLATLRGALASALVNYPFAVEVVVCDDGNDPETQRYLASIEDPRLRVFVNPKNLGMVGNWNRCLGEAKGKWFKLLCDDDELLDGALQKEVELGESRAEVSLVSGLSLEVEESSFKNADRLKNAHRVGIRQPGLYSKEELFPRMVREENLVGPPPAVLFRREFLPKFNPVFGYATDWAAWVELLEKGDLLASGAPSCVFRLHADNLTKRFVASNMDFVEVFALRAVAHAKSGRGGISYWLAFIYRVLRRILRLLLLGEAKTIPRFVGSWSQIYKRRDEFLSSTRN